MNSDELIDVLGGTHKYLEFDAVVPVYKGLLFWAKVVGWCAYGKDKIRDAYVTGHGKTPLSAIDAMLNKIKPYDS